MEGSKNSKITPILGYEEVAKITSAWNKNIQRLALSCLKNQDEQKKIELYFKECISIQLDFLNHFVPSYRTKATLLNIGLAPRADSYLQRKVPAYGAKSSALMVLRERAQAMAASSTPDMWLLASMDTGNSALSYYLSHSNNLSAWWHPLLEKLHPTEFKKDNWQRYLPTTVLERPVPDNIMVAYHLTTGATTIQEQIASLMATADVVQNAAFGMLDLSAILFEMD